MMQRRLTAAVAVAFVALFGAVHAQEAQTGKTPAGRISGRVIAADARRPIKGARVRAVSPQGRQLYAGTNAEGRFEFTGLAAGTYRLDASAERYLAMHFGGQPYTGLSAVVPKAIELRDAQHFDAADFVLPRGAALEGTVIDEFGHPAPNINIQVSQTIYAGGRRRLVPIGAGRPQPTDDKGHFRVYGLAPGDYYITALSGAFTEQNETGGFAPTYFPGVPDATAAQRIRLGYAEERTNLSLQMIPAKMAQVSGRVVDASGAPAGRVGVMLSPSDRLGAPGFMITRGSSNADGTFTFRNVPPGSYTLQAFGRQTTSAGNLGASEFGWLPVVVDSVSHADLVIRVRKGPSLKGRVVLEDTNGPALSAKDVYVQAVPIEFDSAPVGGGPPPFVMNDDWTFEVSNLSGQRIVRVNVRSAQWMLKRITRDGIDITDAPVDLRKEDVGDVEVVLTSKVTAVSGSVTDAAGQPTADYSVVIFAADDEKWTDRSRFIAIARPNQGGSFIARALPPENYLAIALAGVMGSEWQDPEFLARIKDRATPVAVGDGEMKKIALKLQPR
jgi:protocatechuate 3,4-dioxygenase beta subunit